MIENPKVGDVVRSWYYDGNCFENGVIECLAPNGLWKVNFCWPFAFDWKLLPDQQRVDWEWQYLDAKSMQIVKNPNRIRHLAIRRAILGEQRRVLGR